MRKYRYTPLIVILALVLAVLTYAFAAGITVDKTFAAEGHSVIPNMTAINVHYTLNDIYPGTISSVAFTIPTDPVAPTNLTDTTIYTVRAKLDGGTTWANCTGTYSNPNNTFNCSVNTPVLSAAQLQIQVFNK